MVDRGKETTNRWGKMRGKEPDDRGGQLSRKERVGCFARCTNGTEKRGKNSTYDGR